MTLYQGVGLWGKAVFNYEPARRLRTDAATGRGPTHFVGPTARWAYGASMYGVWSAAVWIVGSLVGGVNPGALLISIDARAEFRERWDDALVTVRFAPPSSLGDDADFRPWHEVSGAVVRWEGHAVVVAPLMDLRGARDIEVRFRDGQRSAATPRWPERDEDKIPLVRLDLQRPEVLEGRKVLEWAEPEAVVPGAVGWVLEEAGFHPPDGSPPPSVLVDSGLGEAVEWPLDRLFYVALARADGRPLLDADGRILCVVYRQVPGTERTSLCAPREVALTPVTPKRARAKDAEPEPPRPATGADLP